MWFLFLEGRLPDAAESARFAAEIARLRVLPAELRPLLSGIALAGREFRPLAGLRTALSPRPAGWRRPGTPPPPPARPTRCSSPRSRRPCSLRCTGCGPGWSRWSHVPISAPPRTGSTWCLHELKPDRQLYANVEFYAGVAMELCGIPRSMFTPTFAVSRVVGWAANVLEQAAERRIIRPAARYVGPPAP